MKSSLPEDGLLPAVLCGVSGIYSRLVKARSCLYRSGFFLSRSLPCRVISIGNITMGGTGKTPMTIKVARLLREMGYRTAIVSRGYKGRASDRGGIVGDGRNVFMTSDVAGDEPFMMATQLKDVSIAVGKNRFAAAMLLVDAFQPEIIILDDGFQHWRLKRDIDIVLLDYKMPFGNSFLFPRGTLREEPRQLSRADAVILTRVSDISDSPFHTSRPINDSIPTFHARHAPYIHCVIDTQRDIKPDCPEMSYLKEKKLFLFSGIARNDDFQKMMYTFCARIAGCLNYPDHYAYTRDDIEHISDIAAKKNADVIVTTEKDFVKLPRDAVWPLEVVVVGVDIELMEGDDCFKAFLKHSLQDIP